MPNRTPTTFVIGRKRFLWLALALIAAKFAIFILTQSVFSSGSRTYMILSIGTDIINVSVCFLSMSRMRDAGRSGVLGFLGGIASSYGSFIFLIFLLVHNHIDIDTISLGMINVTAQVTLLVFVISIGRRPSMSGPNGSGTSAAVRNTKGRRGSVPHAARQVRPVDLPVTWTVGQNTSLSPKLVLIPILFIGMGVGVIFIDHLVVGVLNIAIFSFLLFMIVNRWLASRRLGPSSITIDADGFIDRRISDLLIPWSSVTKTITRKEYKSEKVSGVMLVSDFTSIRRSIAKYYRSAYSLPASKSKMLFFIDLRGLQNADGVAETITSLAQHARSTRINGETL